MLIIFIIFNDNLKGIFNSSKLSNILEPSKGIIGSKLNIIINFYKKDIVVTDSSLINALKSYEKNMLDVSDTTFASINNLIMESYGGNI